MNKAFLITVSIMMMFCASIFANTSTAASTTTSAAAAANTNTASAAPAAISASAQTATAALSVTAPAAPAGISGSAAALTKTAIAALSVTTPAAPAGISGSAAALALTTTGALSVTTDAKQDIGTYINVTFGTSELNKITLYWNKISKEQFYYNVYSRIAKQEYSRINKDLLSTETYVDAGITTATIYYYKIQVIDPEGNTHMSKSFSAESTGLIFPGEPQNLKGFQDVESAQLKWDAGTKGSEETSGYNIYRGNTTTASAMKFVAFVPAAKIQYTDIGVTPAVKYYYVVRTVDISNRESKDSDFTSVIPFPFPRTGLILMPTAFRNDINSNYGLNVDCMFSYYIGQIFGAHDNIGNYITKGTDSIQKVGVWLLTADAKWCLFNESEAMPSIAAGYLYTMLLQDEIGAPISSNTTSVEQQFGAKTSYTSLSSVYFAMSKKLFWETTFHGGYIMGSQDEFLPYLSQYLNTTDETNSAYFVGISRPIFARMGLRLEYTSMIGASMAPWLVNLHIDRLSSFDFAYFHFNGGYSVLGYLSFRFTVFPTPYK